MSQIFISGEKINLCVPNEDDFEVWASWFNSMETTKHLEQGKFPHTVQQQKEFYYNAIQNNRFLAHIKDKQGKLLGVISLSDINYEKSSCQVAIVCPVKSNIAKYAALEARALVTQHAFDRFGLHRVWAGQSYPSLNGWSQYLEIIGYKTEGIIRKGFVHGSTVTPTNLLSITSEDYNELLKRRQGCLWPGEEKASFLLKKIKQYDPLVDQVFNSLQDLYDNHSKIMYEIESSYDK